MSKWMMKARPSTQVTHWEVNKVLLGDKDLEQLALQFSQRRVNVTWESEIVNVHDFADYCEHVQKAVHSVLDFSEYARVGVLLKIASKSINDEKAAKMQNLEIVSKRIPPFGNFSKGIAMHVWDDEDPTSHIRRSIKVDLHKVQMPSEIKDAEIKLETTWQTTIELDRFIQARIPKDTPIIDFIKETAKDFEKLAQESFGLNVEILEEN